MSSWDVIVVGSGNAGMCAAHAARAQGARVLVAESAPKDWAGGNSYFTAGAFRTAHPGLPGVAPLLDHPDQTQLEKSRLDLYSPEAYFSDLNRVTDGRCDPTLGRILAEESWTTMEWLRDVGLRFRLMYERQSYRIGAIEQFWGGLAIGTVDGGKGLVAQHFDAARRTGIEMAMEHHLTRVEPAATSIQMVFRTPAGDHHISAGAVVIAAGGFESDPDRRARHLGESWRTAKVRGTPYNTGDALDLLLDLGAARAGDWAGCHATQWDRNAPEVGDREMTNRYTKQSYPLGILVNFHGERFLDEGEDFRNLTYAKYGRAVRAQPESTAFQIFDAKTSPLLRAEEYELHCGSRFEATTIENLAAQSGLDPMRLGRTVDEFNAAINDTPFDPAIKDGKAANGIHPPKSNWAQKIDTPPFVAYAVTGAITFTFGGVKIDEHGSVIDTRDRPIPRVFAAGEAVGGLFYGNYPGGSGLMAGSVFGKRAGQAACYTTVDESL